MSPRSGQAPSAHAKDPTGKMDWKAYYRSERETREASGKIDRWIRSAAREPNAELIDGIRRGGIVSFPHTTLDTAGPLDAHIVTALHATGVRRIVCLGVLHGGCLPADAQRAFRLALDPTAEPTDRRRALTDIGGTFLLPQLASATGRDENRFAGHAGTYDQILADPDPSVVRADLQGVCRHEFSLDTFLAVLAAYSERFPQFLPEILPVYVGVTQCAERSFHCSAPDVAAALSKLLTQDTACVATGDLIHYGPFYGVTVPGAPGTDPNRAFRLVRARLETLLTQTLDKGLVDDESFEAATTLGNDQRFVLPIIAALLGPHASAKTLSFDMVDYSRILSTPPPCFVAATLAAYVPALQACGHEQEKPVC